MAQFPAEGEESDIAPRTLTVEVIQKNSGHLELEQRKITCCSLRQVSLINHLVRNFRSQISIVVNFLKVILSLLGTRSVLLRILR
jgi:hypothetical protein